MCTSKRNPKFHYYGYTGNLEQRLRYHNRGKVRTTNRFKPVELLGYREFETKEEALEFEKKLKKSASARKKFIKELNENRQAGNLKVACLTTVGGRYVRIAVPDMSHSGRYSRNQFWEIFR
ncbi:hypothetical protein GF362_04505 [Candidatus Dojkabacteria bacterium]|nr:hypothetical protein [Candidatus Dojkabacteria bacterium]